MRNRLEDLLAWLRSNPKWRTPKLPSPVTFSSKSWPSLDESISDSDMALINALQRELVERHENTPLAMAGQHADYAINLIRKYIVNGCLPPGFTREEISDALDVIATTGNQRFEYEAVYVSQGGTNAMPIASEELTKRLKQIALVDCSVLLTGETGTGKEYYANQIHEFSARKNKPFVALNCASLTKGLFEGELFGSRKGAFTGADRDRDGLAKTANGGTIFLDEVGDLPPECQANLLRFLQDNEIRPLGGTPETVDVRILAATNKPDRLPPDAIHRFDTTLPLPPLRNRKGDIPELVKTFFDMTKQKSGKSSLRLTKAEMDKLAEDAFDWPGNIRQLEKALLNAVLHHESGRDLTADEVLAAARQVELLT